jgi:hypothetical protein
MHHSDSTGHSRRPQPTQIFTVTDGCLTVGTVELIESGHYIAIDTAGVEIGHFGSLAEASRAFPAGDAR